LFADDLLQVLNILDIDQAHIVGLSMGSTIAAVFHDRYPERVKSITLCDGSMGYPRAAEEDAEFLRLRKDPLVNGLEPADIAEFVAMSLSGNKTDVVNIDKIAASMRMLRKENYIKALDASVSCKDMRHQYTGIRVPALLIVGELDTLTPPGPMRETAAQIPNAEFQVIPGAGHLPNIEKPETFNQILSTFLDSVERDCLLKRRE